MSNEVRGSEFSDQVINDFFDSVTEVRWSAVEPVPDWVRQEADAFATSNPRPAPDTLRRDIDHAVVVARGWDHPHDHGLMFSAAVKSFYLLAWLEHVQQRLIALEDPERIDLNLAMKVSFTPVTNKRVRTDLESGPMLADKEEHGKAA